MRQCPKCLYTDPPNWRPPPHYPTIDYVRWDEFQELIPDLASRLLPGWEIEDDLYVYHRSKPANKRGAVGYVYRVWRPIWAAYGPQGWKAVRSARMYDTSGRLNEAAWKKLSRMIAARAAFKRSHRGALERFIPNGRDVPQVVIQHKELGDKE